MLAKISQDWEGSVNFLKTLLFSAFSVNARSWLDHDEMFNDIS